MTTRVKTLLPQILKIYVSSPKKLKTYKTFKKNFSPKMILWRNRVHLLILICLPKTFSSSTVMVRSKFRRLWKKRELSKVWVFYSKSSSGHVECSFIKHIKNYPPKFKKNFFSIYFTSNTNISRRIQIDTYNAFWQPDENSVATNPNNIMFQVRNKWKLTKISKKKFLPQNDTLKT